MGPWSRWAVVGTVFVFFCLGLYSDDRAIGRIKFHTPEDRNVVDHTVRVAEKGSKQGVKRGEALFFPLVILLSSVPRSGSTVVAELLSSFKHNSVIFFEPLSGHMKESGFRNGTAVPGFLRQLSTCAFGQDFEVWLKRKTLFLQFFHPEAMRCFQGPKEGESACRRNLNLKSLCLEADMRIVKVIRSRLSWVGRLLQDEALWPKVIHLNRDPRASINSARSLGWKKKAASRCHDLDSDLRDFDRLVAQYPTRLLRLSLEELSLRPTVVTQRVFSFLHGDQRLPPTTQWFIESHLRARKPTSGSMSTHKESQREYQAWRWEISAQVLKDVEEDPVCRRVIKGLGHVIFGSLEVLKNASVPLIGG